MDTMTNHEQTKTLRQTKNEARLTAYAEELRSYGWDVKLETHETENSTELVLSANNAPKWYGRLLTINFGVSQYTWHDGSRHVITGGRFFAMKNSASRQIDRRIYDLADLHSIVAIDGQVYGHREVQS